MFLQAMVDGMSEQWKRERAETQMTLGKLISSLEAMSEGSEVANLNGAHSYRGYYSDLAFEQDEGLRSSAELLVECKAAMGKVFSGYKGGDYVMGELTPVWIADYGCCGQKLMSIHPDGLIETAEDD